MRESRYNQLLINNREILTMYQVEVKHEGEKLYTVVAKIDNHIQALKRFNEIGSMLWNNQFAKIDVALRHPNGKQMLHKTINSYEVISDKENITIKTQYHHTEQNDFTNAILELCETFSDTLSQLEIKYCLGIIHNSIG